MIKETGGLCHQSGRGETGGRAYGEMLLLPFLFWAGTVHHIRTRKKNLKLFCSAERKLYNRVGHGRKFWAALRCDAEGR
jgi:hypothetical protein